MYPSRTDEERSLWERAYRTYRNHVVDNDLDWTPVIVEIIMKTGIVDAILSPLKRMTPPDLFDDVYSDACLWITDSIALFKIDPDRPIEDFRSYITKIPWRRWCSIVKHRAKFEELDVVVDYRGHGGYARVVMTEYPDRVYAWAEGVLRFRTGTARGDACRRIVRGIVDDHSMGTIRRAMQGELLSREAFDAVYQYCMVVVRWARMMYIKDGS
jgi:hypothetical protein